MNGNRDNAVNNGLTTVSLARAIRVAFAASMALPFAVVTANPSGENVVNGAADFDRSQPDTLEVNQHTDRAIIEWEDFSIQQNETTRFVQPSSSSSVLNRVVGNNVSEIHGRLEANGQVVVVNERGVSFGKDGRVDVQGGLVASTRNITNENYMNKNMQFNGQSKGKVVNRGEVVSANGAGVYMIGDSVVNTGSVQAGGAAALLGGSSANINNAQAPTVSGAGSVSNTGSVKAAQIDLRASGRSNTQVHAGGSLDASNAAGRGGRVTVQGQNITVDGRIDASGKTGGGQISVGGGWQGQDASIENADDVLVTAAAQLLNDSSESGDAGQTVVWSDNKTEFKGSVSAQAKGASGDGAQVEVSGKKELNFAGQVNASSVNGEAGTLLLDPQDLLVDVVQGVGISAILATGTSVEIKTSGGISNGGTATATPLVGDEVTTDLGVDQGTDSDGNPILYSQAGNVTFAAGVTIEGLGKFTVTADGDIVMDAAGGAITIDTDGGVELTADNDNLGYDNTDNDFAENGGGSVTLKAGAGGEHVTVDGGAGGVLIRQGVDADDDLLIDATAGGGVAIGSGAAAADGKVVIAGEEGRTDIGGASDGDLTIIAIDDIEIDGGQTAGAEEANDALNVGVTGRVNKADGSVVNDGYESNGVVISYTGNNKNFGSGRTDVLIRSDKNILIKDNTIIETSQQSNRNVDHDSDGDTDRRDRLVTEDATFVLSAGENIELGEEATRSGIVSVGGEFTDITLLAGVSAHTEGAEANDIPDADGSIIISGGDDKSWSSYTFTQVGYRLTEQRGNDTGEDYKIDPDQEGVEHNNVHAKNGDITLKAGGEVKLQGGKGDVSYVQVGHGGSRFDVEITEATGEISSAGSTMHVSEVVDSDILVNSGMFAGATLHDMHLETHGVGKSFARMGHGYAMSTSSEKGATLKQGDISGEIDVIVDNAGNLNISTVYAALETAEDDIDHDEFNAQIGSGAWMLYDTVGDGDDSNIEVDHGKISGDITVTLNDDEDGATGGNLIMGAATAADAPDDKFTVLAQIGHGANVRIVDPSTDLEDNVNTIQVRIGQIANFEDISGAESRGSSADGVAGNGEASENGTDVTVNAGSVLLQALDAGKNSGGDTADVIDNLQRNQIGHGNYVRQEASSAVSIVSGEDSVDEAAVAAAVVAAKVAGAAYEAAAAAAGEAADAAGAAYAAAVKAEAADVDAKKAALDDALDALTKGDVAVKKAAFEAAVLEAEATTAGITIETVVTEGQYLNGVVDLDIREGDISGNIKVQDTDATDANGITLDSQVTVGLIKIGNDVMTNRIGHGSGMYLQTLNGANEDIDEGSETEFDGIVDQSDTFRAGDVHITQANIIGANIDVSTQKSDWSVLEADDQDITLNTLVAAGLSPAEFNTTTSQIGHGGEIMINTGVGSAGAPSEASTRGGDVEIFVGSVWDGVYEQGFAGEDDHALYGNVLSDATDHESDVRITSSDQIHVTSMVAAALSPAKSNNALSEIGHGQYLYVETGAGGSSAEDNDNDNGNKDSASGGRAGDIVIDQNTRNVQANADSGNENSNSDEGNSARDTANGIRGNIILTAIGTDVNDDYNLIYDAHNTGALAVAQHNTVVSTSGHGAHMEFWTGSGGDSGHGDSTAGNYAGTVAEDKYADNATGAPVRGDGGDGGDITVNLGDTLIEGDQVVNVTGGVKVEAYDTQALSGSKESIMDAGLGHDPRIFANTGDGGKGGDQVDLVTAMGGNGGDIDITHGSITDREGSTGSYPATYTHNGTSDITVRVHAIYDETADALKGTFADSDESLLVKAYTNGGVGEKKGDNIWAGVGHHVRLFGEGGVGGEGGHLQAEFDHSSALTGYEGGPNTSGGRGGDVSVENKNIAGNIVIDVDRQIHVHADGGHGGDTQVIAQIGHGTDVFTASQEGGMAGEMYDPTFLGTDAADNAQGADNDGGIEATDIAGYNIRLIDGNDDDKFDNTVTQDGQYSGRKDSIGVEIDNGIVQGTTQADDATADHKDLDQGKLASLDLSLVVNQGLDTNVLANAEDANAALASAGIGLGNDSNQDVRQILVDAGITDLAAASNADIRTALTDAGILVSSNANIKGALIDAEIDLSEDAADATRTLVQAGVNPNATNAHKEDGVGSQDKDGTSALVNYQVDDAAMIYDHEGNSQFIKVIETAADGAVLEYYVANTQINRNVIAQNTQGENGASKYAIHDDYAGIGLYHVNTYQRDIDNDGDNETVSQFVYNDSAYISRDRNGSITNYETAQLASEGAINARWAFNESFDGEYVADYKAVTVDLEDHELSGDIDFAEFDGDSRFDIIDVDHDGILDELDGQTVEDAGAPTEVLVPAGEDITETYVVYKKQTQDGEYTYTHVEKDADGNDVETIVKIPYKAGDIVLIDTDGDGKVDEGQPVGLGEATVTREVPKVDANGNYVVDANGDTVYETKTFTSDANGEITEVYQLGNTYKLEFNSPNPDHVVDYQMVTGMSWSEAKTEGGWQLEDFSTANGGRGGDVHARVGITTGDIWVDGGDTALNGGVLTDESIVVESIHADGALGDHNDAYQARIGHGAWQVADAHGEFLERKAGRISGSVHELGVDATIDDQDAHVAANGGDSNDHEFQFAINASGGRGGDALNVMGAAHDIDPDRDNVVTETDHILGNIHVNDDQLLEVVDDNNNVTGYRHSSDGTLYVTSTVNNGYQQVIDLTTGRDVSINNRETLNRDLRTVTGEEGTAVHFNALYHGQYMSHDAQGIRLTTDEGALAKNNNSLIAQIGHGATSFTFTGEGGDAASRGNKIGPDDGTSITEIANGGRGGDGRTSQHQVKGAIDINAGRGNATDDAQFSIVMETAASAIHGADDTYIAQIGHGRQSTLNTGKGGLSDDGTYRNNNGRGGDGTSYQSDILDAAISLNTSVFDGNGMSMHSDLQGISAGTHLFRTQLGHGDLAWVGTGKNNAGVEAGFADPGLGGAGEVFQYSTEQFNQTANGGRGGDMVSIQGGYNGDITVDLGSTDDGSPEALKIVSESGSEATSVGEIHMLTNIGHGAYNTVASNAGGQSVQDGPPTENNITHGTDSSGARGGHAIAVTSANGIGRDLSNRDGYIYGVSDGDGSDITVRMHDDIDSDNLREEIMIDRENVVDLDGNASFTVSAPAVNGTATVINTDAGRQVRYTPQADFTGTDTFTVTLTLADGTTRDEVLTVEVTETNTDQSLKLEQIVTSRNQSVVLNVNDMVDENLTDGRVGDEALDKDAVAGYDGILIETMTGGTINRDKATNTNTASIGHTSFNRAFASDANGGDSDLGTLGNHVMSEANGGDGGDAVAETGFINGDVIVTNVVEGDNSHNLQGVDVNNSHANTDTDITLRTYQDAAPENADHVGDVRIGHHVEQEALAENEGGRANENVKPPFSSDATLSSQGGDGGDAMSIQGMLTGNVKVEAENSVHLDAQDTAVGGSSNIASIGHHQESEARGGAGGLGGHVMEDESEIAQAGSNWLVDDQEKYDGRTEDAPETQSTQSQHTQDASNSNLNEQGESSSAAFAQDSKKYTGNTANDADNELLSAQGKGPLHEVYDALYELKQGLTAGKDIYEAWDALSPHEQALIRPIVGDLDVNPQYKDREAEVATETTVVDDSLHYGVADRLTDDELNGVVEVVVDTGLPSTSTTANPNLVSDDARDNALDGHYQGYNSTGKSVLNGYTVVDEAPDDRNSATASDTAESTTSGATTVATEAGWHTAEDNDVENWDHDQNNAGYFDESRRADLLDFLDRFVAGRRDQDVDTIDTPELSTDEKETLAAIMASSGDGGNGISTQGEIHGQIDVIARTRDITDAARGLLVHSGSIAADPGFSQAQVGHGQDVIKVLGGDAGTVGDGALDKANGIGGDGGDAYITQGIIEGDINLGSAHMIKIDAKDAAASATEVRTFVGHRQQVGEERVKYLEEAIAQGGLGGEDAEGIAQVNGHNGSGGNVAIDQRGIRGDIDLYVNDDKDDDKQSIWIFANDIAVGGEQVEVHVGHDIHVLSAEGGDAGQRRAGPPLTADSGDDGVLSGVIGIVEGHGGDVYIKQGSDGVAIASNDVVDGAYTNADSDLRLRGRDDVEVHALTTADGDARALVGHEQSAGEDWPFKAPESAGEDRAEVEAKRVTAGMGGDSIADDADVLTNNDGDGGNVDLDIGRIGGDIIIQSRTGDVDLLSKTDAGGDADTEIGHQRHFLVESGEASDMEPLAQRTAAEGGNITINRGALAGDITVEALGQDEYDKEGPSGNAAPTTNEIREVVIKSESPGGGDAETLLGHGEYMHLSTGRGGYGNEEDKSIQFNGADDGGTDYGDYLESLAALKTTDATDADTPFGDGATDAGDIMTERDANNAYYAAQNLVRMLENAERNDDRLSDVDAEKLDIALREAKESLGRIAVARDLYRGITSSNSVSDTAANFIAVAKAEAGSFDDVPELPTNTSDRNITLTLGEAYKLAESVYESPADAAQQISDHADAGHIIYEGIGAISGDINVRSGRDTDFNDVIDNYYSHEETYTDADGNTVTGMGGLVEIYAENAGGTTAETELGHRRFNINSTGIIHSNGEPGAGGENDGGPHDSKPDNSGNGGNIEITNVTTGDINIKADELAVTVKGDAASEIHLGHDVEVANYTAESNVDDFIGSGGNIVSRQYVGDNPFRKGEETANVNISTNFVASENTGPNAGSSKDAVLGSDGGDSYLHLGIQADSANHAQSDNKKPAGTGSDYKNRAGDVDTLQALNGDVNIDLDSDRDSKYHDLIIQSDGADAPSTTRLGHYATQGATAGNGGDKGAGLTEGLGEYVHTTGGERRSVNVLAEDDGDEVTAVQTVHGDINISKVEDLQVLSKAAADNDTFIGHDAFNHAESGFHDAATGPESGGLTIAEQMITGGIMINTSRSFTMDLNDAASLGEVHVGHSGEQIAISANDVFKAEVKSADGPVTENATDVISTQYINAPISVATGEIYITSQAAGTIKDADVEGTGKTGKGIAAHLGHESKVTVTTQEDGDAVSMAKIGDGAITLSTVGNANLHSTADEDDTVKLADVNPHNTVYGDIIIENKTTAGEVQVGHYHESHLTDDVIPQPQGSVAAVFDNNSEILVESARNIGVLDSIGGVARVGHTLSEEGDHVAAPLQDAAADHERPEGVTAKANTDLIAGTKLSQYFDADETAVVTDTQKSRIVQDIHADITIDAGDNLELLATLGTAQIGHFSPDTNHGVKGISEQVLAGDITVTTGLDDDKTKIADGVAMDSASDARDDDMLMKAGTGLVLVGHDHAAIQDFTTPADEAVNQVQKSAGDIMVRVGGDLHVIGTGGIAAQIGHREYNFDAPIALADDVNLNSYDPNAADSNGDIATHTAKGGEVMQDTYTAPMTAGTPSLARNEEVPVRNRISGNTYIGAGENQDEEDSNLTANVMVFDGALANSGYRDYVGQSGAGELRFYALSQENVTIEGETKFNDSAVMTVRGPGDPSPIVHTDHTRNDGLFLDSVSGSHEHLYREWGTGPYYNEYYGAANFAFYFESYEPQTNSASYYYEPEYMALHRALGLGEVGFSGSDYGPHPTSAMIINNVNPAGGLYDEVNATQGNKMGLWYASPGLGADFKRHVSRSYPEMNVTQKPSVFNKATPKSAASSACSTAAVAGIAGLKVASCDAAKTPVQPVVQSAPAQAPVSMAKPAAPVPVVAAPAAEPVEEEGGELNGVTGVKLNTSDASEATKQEGGVLNKLSRLFTKQA